MKSLATIAILALAGLAGCGGSEEDSYTLVKVRGTLTNSGKPLANATVLFIPAGNKNITPGSAQTDSEGNYTLMFKERTGVSPGKYKVVVEPAGEGATAAHLGEAYKNDPIGLHLEELARSKGSNRAAKPKPEVVKMEFDAEVKEDGSTTIDYDFKAPSSGKVTAKN